MEAIFAGLLVSGLLGIWVVGLVMRPDMDGAWGNQPIGRPRHLK